MGGNKDYSQVPAGENRPPVPSSLQTILKSPRPDWSEAPEWANWWSVDADGDIFWSEIKPMPHKSSASWQIDFSKGRVDFDQNIDIPIGIDWRTLIEERPNVP